MGPLVIVGAAPNRNGDGVVRAFAGSRSADRLARAANLPWAEFERRARVINLNERWPGSAKGRGDERPLLTEEAREAFLARHSGHRLLLCGDGVRAALRLPRAPLVWVRERDFHYAVIPHPSGLSSGWKDLNLVGDFLRSALLA